VSISGLAAWVGDEIAGVDQCQDLD
jgi:hypothetical protein